MIELQLCLDSSGKGTLYMPRFTHRLIVVITLALIGTLAGSGSAKTRTAKCDKGKSLQKQIDKAKPGDTIVITGTCEENVVITADKANLIFTVAVGGDGISGDSIRPTMEVRGRDITIQFLHLTGGTDVVVVLGGGNVTLIGSTISKCNREGDGVVIDNGSTAHIGLRSENSFGSNTISGCRVGILVDRSSGATIAANTITENTAAGIVVVNGSAAKIGISNTFGRNTITNNGSGSNGITVSNTSTAEIFGNTIRGNVGNGIEVGEGSSARIENNIIEDNTENGVEVSGNSTVKLHQNETGADKNGGHGLLCKINSSAVGALDELDGAAGVKKAETDCTDLTD